MSQDSTSLQPIHSRKTLIYGLTFVVLGIVLFVGFCYASVLSKLLPPFGNRLMSAIRNDRYYCLLVPLTPPAVMGAIYFHWLSMKLFKHA